MAYSYLHSRRKSRASTALPAMAPPRGPALWRRLVAPPDPMQLDAGASGELLVAEVRLFVTLLLLAIPVIDLAGTSDPDETFVGLGVALIAALGALLVYVLLRRGYYRSWFGFASGVYDVTLVSLALATFLLIDRPHTAVNSRVVFEAYFLAIGATSLRYDVRICITAGALAVAEYSAIVLYAANHWNLNDPAFAPFAYGYFDWSSQVARIILLAIAVLLSATIVLRTQSLRRLSRSDRLTGLPNRSYFDERVIAELSRCRRSGEPLSLAMIDVDFFKRFNDSYGHAAGDVALRLVAQTIQQGIRASDLVVRYGGEEFVAVFPGMSAERAIDRIEMIRRAVAAAMVELPRGGAPGKLTISAGVATLRSDGIEVEDLLDVADSRLFQAKASGRDQVVGPVVEPVSPANVSRELLA